MIVKIGGGGNSSLHPKDVGFFLLNNWFCLLFFFPVRILAVSSMHRKYRCELDELEDLMKKMIDQFYEHFRRNIILNIKY